MSIKNTVKLAIVMAMTASLGLAAAQVSAAPNKCPSIESIKENVSSKGLKMYGDRYLVRQYSRFDTSNEWEFVVTNLPNTNVKEDLKDFNNNMASLQGKPSPSDSKGKGTWFCEYKMNNHKVVANYPVLCAKDVCAR